MHFELFDLVELVSDIPDQGLKKGARGAVVDIFGDYEAYDVEFDDFQLVVLRQESIRLIARNKTAANV